MKRANRLRLGDRSARGFSRDVLTSMIGCCAWQARLRGHRGLSRRRLLSAGLGADESPSEARSVNAWTTGASLRCHSPGGVGSHGRPPRPKLTPCYEEWVRWTSTPRRSTTADEEGRRVLDLPEIRRLNPWLAYLGNEGYWSTVSCEGSEHCQDGMPQFLDETIDYARQITRRNSWCGWMRATTTWRTCGVARSTRWTGSSSENLRKNRWRTGWRKPRPWRMRRASEGKQVWTGTTGRRWWQAVPVCRGH